MATNVYQIEDFRARLHGEQRRPAPCYCDALRAAHEVFASELDEVRRTTLRPQVLCLENLEAGIPSNASGWDLIYSSALLLTLPAAAAREVIKTAMARLKSGGRLLMANTLAEAPVRSCPVCRDGAKQTRNEAEIAELTLSLPSETVGGQAIFRDRKELNVILELHKACAARGQDYEAAA